MSGRERQITEEDHSIISKRLLVLIATESKREKKEEKEKQEQFVQLKARDSKELSVVLLRGVLMEMGVSFKSNDKKARLI